jgi:hypothetical protein
VDRNETPVSLRISRFANFGELVRLHTEDRLQRELGAIKMLALDRE